LSPSRTLSATPLAILSLARAITAVFSFVHAALLRPLPYPAHDGLAAATTAVTIPEFEFW
jgi:hypothetical protein